MEIIAINTLKDMNEEMLKEEIEKTKEGTSPREKEKPKPKPRVRKTEQQQILEVLKNIQRLLALPLSGVARNDKDNKFVERMNK